MYRESLATQQKPSNVLGKKLACAEAASSALGGAPSSPVVPIPPQNLPFDLTVPNYNCKKLAREL